MTANRFNFRAYIKSLNKIYRVYELNNDGVLSIECIKEDNTILKRNDNEPQLFLFKKDEFVLMQSTGLKDKNGKEIYEGDIVAHIPSLSQVQCYIVENYYNLVFTKKNDKNFKIDLHYVVNNNLLEKIEVIGNIFENKDLLKN